MTVIHGVDETSGRSVPMDITSGAASVNIQNWNTNLEFTGTAGAADDAVTYTSVDVSEYNYHAIAVTGTDPADVEVSLNGTDFVVASTVLVDNVTTGGGLAVITIPTGKVGILRGKFKKIRVLQDGATDANCYGLHGVV